MGHISYSFQFIAQERVEAWKCRVRTRSTWPLVQVLLILEVKLWLNLLFALSHVALTARKVSRVSGYFEGQFKSPNAQDLGTLTLSSITSEEVLRALKTLKNHRACWTDMIPNELLKYGGLALAENIARILNAIFKLKRDEVISTIRQGALGRLQNPGKLKGKLKSLCPVVVLLNSIHKVFCLVVLERIIMWAAVGGPWTDTSQPPRVLSSRAVLWPTSSLPNVHVLSNMAQDKVSELHILGIDFSLAFDTVDRHKLLHVSEMTNSMDVVRTQTTLYPRMWDKPDGTF